MKATTGKAKKSEFPKTVKVQGVPHITATIYRQARTKPDKEGNPQTYVSFIASYALQGKRRMVVHKSLAEATTAAEEAIKKIAQGKQAVLELTNRDREIHLRAKEIIAPFGKDLDVVAAEWAETKTILNGWGSGPDAARYVRKAHSKELPRITVPDAVKKCIEQCRADGRSKARLHQLENYLNAFAEDMNVDVTELTPGIISRYLTAMTASERTKKNARDVLAFFGRWLVLHGYLERGTDLVEGVQRYSMKPGEIHIFSPAELGKLIEHADDRLLPYIVIGAFAGLRGAEIQRLEWSEIDLGDKFIEIKAAKAKTDTRRLVPIEPNLAAWLEDYKDESGLVCPFQNVVNQLMKLVAKVNEALPKGTPEKERLHWKKNALRHSYISYRVAKCADIARVADESGNSPAIIKANYLKRVKPAVADEWFNIMPATRDSGIIPHPAVAV